MHLLDTGHSPEAENATALLKLSWSGFDECPEGKLPRNPPKYSALSSLMEGRWDILETNNAESRQIRIT